MAIIKSMENEHLKELIKYFLTQIESKLSKPNSSFDLVYQLKFIVDRDDPYFARILEWDWVKYPYYSLDRAKREIEYLSRESLQEMVELFREVFDVLDLENFWGPEGWKESSGWYFL